MPGVSPVAADLQDAAALKTALADSHAFNTANGDVFRWPWLWPQLAAYFGVEPQGPPPQTAPLEPRMDHAAEAWRTFAEKHHLAEPDVNKLVSWWHTDGDLGRKIECVNDLTNSRLLGFHDYQPTQVSFFELFGRLQAERVILG